MISIEDQFSPFLKAKMSKRIVSFDTCFLKRGLILDEYYSKENHLYVVQDTVIIETYPHDLGLFSEDEFYLVPDFNEIIRGELFRNPHDLRKELTNPSRKLNDLVSKLKEDASKKEI